jgi:hypothetical protein
VGSRSLFGCVWPVGCCSLFGCVWPVGLLRSLFDGRGLWDRSLFGCVCAGGLLLAVWLRLACGLVALVVRWTWFVGSLAVWLRVARGLVARCSVAPGSWACRAPCGEAWIGGACCARSLVGPWSPRSGAQCVSESPTRLVKSPGLRSYRRAPMRSARVRKRARRRSASSNSVLRAAMSSPKAWGRCST